MNHLGVVVSPRVNQLDASLLDSELLEQLKTKLFDAFKFYGPAVKEDYEPELMLVLKALLFKFTIWDHSTTYGAKLQNLVLVNSSTKRPICHKTRALYGVITILGPYVWLKLHERRIFSVEFLDRASLLWNAATLLNFLAFIFSGNYLTFVLRVLGARFAAVDRHSIRNVNYEFQNRQLIWNALTEFLLFALPLVNFRKIVRKLERLRQSPASSASRFEGPLSFLSRRTCAICYEQEPSIAAKGVTNPHTAGCEHYYCYVCLSLRLAEDPEWRCLKCNTQLSPQNLAPLSA